MDYTKILRKRLYWAVSYLALGIILNITAFVTASENEFLSVFGSALLVMGIVRIVRHVRLVRSDAAVKKQEIAETDERNIMLAEKARSWAYSLTITIAGAAVIVLSLLGYQEQVLPLAWLVCGMTLLYWICWIIIRKKY